MLKTLRTSAGEACIVDNPKLSLDNTRFLLDQNVLVVHEDADPELVGLGQGSGCCMANESSPDTDAAKLDPTLNSKALCDPPSLSLASTVYVYLRVSLHFASSMLVSCLCWVHSSWQQQTSIPLCHESSGK